MTDIEGRSGRGLKRGSVQSHVIEKAIVQAHQVEKPVASMTVLATCDEPVLEASDKAGG